MFRIRWTAVVGLVLAVTGCSALRMDKPPLRVGFTTNYPPLIFEQAGRAVGAEVEFAAELARDLDRSLVLVSMPWDRLFAELEAGTVDMVMAGITVTPARKMRMAFCDSYMDNPLVALVRRGEGHVYTSADEVRGALANVGVLGGTSAEGIVRRQFPNAKVVTLSRPEDVAFHLENQRMDIYVDDMAAALNLISQNEGRLEAVPLALVPQELAWAVRLDHPDLVRLANAALAQWRVDGRLDGILDRWLPYRQALAEILQAN